MFWIGLIVGAIVGIIAWSVFTVKYTLKCMNMSNNEFTDMLHVAEYAGNNRECTLEVRDANGEILDGMILSEK